MDRMKKKVLLFSILLAIAVAGFSQTSKTISKINLVGAGYGLEYFFSPSISWHNEIGISYWEKLNDAVQNTSSFNGITPLNPYFSSSVRYYFSPIQPSKDGKCEIGWRVSATYKGLFTQESILNFSGKNLHQVGVSAGTTILFSKNLYFELDLGPGYEFDPFKGNRFNLLGNMGVGFKF